MRSHNLNGQTKRTKKNIVYKTLHRKLKTGQRNFQHLRLYEDMLFCSTSGACRVTLVISHKRGNKDGILTITNGTSVAICDAYIPLLCFCSNIQNELDTSRSSSMYNKLQQNLKSMHVLFTSFHNVNSVCIKMWKFNNNVDNEENWEWGTCIWLLQVGCCIGEPIRHWKHVLS